MSFIEVQANFERVSETLQRIAEALERIAPIPGVEEVPVPSEERERMVADREAYQDYLNTKQSQGIEVDEWTLAITPRS